VDGAPRDDALPLFDAVTSNQQNSSAFAPALSFDRDDAVRVGEVFLKAARVRRIRSVQAVKVEFKPYRATLFSYRIRDGVALVKMHNAFCQASDEVLEQAAHMMLSGRKSPRRFSKRAAFDTFVHNLPKEAFDQPGARRGTSRAQEKPGRHRSLGASFERVNKDYFAGKMPKPKLCWSPVRARRIVGTYEEQRDRIVFTRRLDAKRIPEYVLDFVMYHELLHKALGTRRGENGKRRMHGPEFRRLERRFPRYREAEEWLTRL